MEVAPKFFATVTQFRAWLKVNHLQCQELWVGFYKKDSGQASITWPDSVDAALCFGWIDGVRKSIDEASYKIRFTPRKSRSKWSAVNVKRMQELQDAGLVQPAGLESFAKRVQEPSGYAYEQKGLMRLAKTEEELFRADQQAWTFFESQPNWYRRTSLVWILRAKREETRKQRLKQLIEDSRQGRTIAPLTRSGSSTRSTDQK